jgi:hypothetical protein
MFELILFLVGLILFDLLALRFGAQSWQNGGRNTWW